MENDRNLRSRLSQYARPSDKTAGLQLLSAVPPYVALWALMIWASSYSYVLSILLSVPAALFVVRIFVLQHDCGHSSLFRTRSANDWVGNLLALATLTPFLNWRHAHNMHHATSGDLSRREHGDIWMMTLAEFERAGRLEQAIYRCFRHPVVLFVFGPCLYFLIRRRFPIELTPAMKRERTNVRWTNVWLFLVYGSLGWQIGYGRLLVVLVPVAAIASSIGVWLFYIQHQFEDAYWSRPGRWNAVDAGIEGSSYYELPRWLNWFTADIAVHHIHHIDSRIPNYQLRRCLEENAVLRPKVSFNVIESFAFARLRLWDESKQRMVGFER